VPVFKPRKCSVCKDRFTPTKPLQKVCGWSCACQVAAKQRVKEITERTKADRRETRAKLEKLKTKSTWLKEAQKEFNAYIRARDAARPCISCRRFHQGEWHAGHYLSTGARPELRFDEDNVHKQCAPCNTHLHGNLVHYREGLIERRGAVVVDRLEGAHEPLHLGIEDLKAIKATYKAKTKELLK
jgi:hypothetical protein